MNAYRGCPSARDFSVFWGYDLNFPRDDKDLGVNVSCSSLLGDMGNDWVPAASFDSQGTGMSAGKEFCPCIDEASTSESELNSLNQTLVLECKPTSYSQQNKALQESQQQQENCSIVQQLLELERLQITESNINSSLTPDQVPTEAHSNKAHTFRELGQNPGKHCQHPQGLDIDLQQVDTIHQEQQAQPLSLLISQSEQINSSSNIGMPLEGVSFLHCRSPVQNSQLWYQNMQELGICEDIDFCDGFNIPDIDLPLRNNDGFFGGGQDQVASIFNDMQDFSVITSVYMELPSHEDIDVGPSKRMQNSNEGMDATHPMQQTFPSLSFSLSRISAETTGSDYLDSGISPNLFGGEPPLNSAKQEIPLSKVRGPAMMRYKEKKKVRM